LRVASCLKYTSSLVKVASCLTLILGDSVRFERDDLPRPRAYPHRGPRRPLMPCKTVETYPPFFLEHFLSGTDNGRDRLIRAWSGLQWLSRYLALSRDSRTIFRQDFVVGSDSRSGLVMGDSQSILFLPDRSCIAGPKSESGSFFFATLFLSGLIMGLFP